MADKDPAKIAAESYAKATDAYAKNQTVQGMAAAQVADAAMKPPEDERTTLLKKIQAGTATDAEKARYNKLLSTTKVEPVPTGEERDALKKKIMAGTATPAEQERYNKLLATKIETPTPVKPLSLQEQRTAQGIGPNGLPLEDPNAVPIISQGINAPVGSREWVLAHGVGPNAIPSGYEGEELDILKNKVMAGTATPEERSRYGEISAYRASRMPHPEAPAVPEEAPAPVSAPAIEAPAIAVTPKAEVPKKSAVDAIIEGMKAETADEKGPNIWDIIQAAAAGWNFQTPAYLERKKTKEAKAAEIEKLSKTAQFEKALQEERLASEAERSRADIASRERIAGIGGIGLPAGATKGQKLGAGFIQGIK